MNSLDIASLLTKIVVRTVQFGPAEPSFQAYAVSIEEPRTRREGGLCQPLGKKRMNMSHSIDKPQHKLRKAPQPPLPHLGASPDSDRAKKPRLADPFATDQELNPGDRVEGLGDFGKPTGEFGTVEQTNEEDAVVKWDDDGRKRLHQPWLKKVSPQRRVDSAASQGAVFDQFLRCTSSVPKV
jgi:hypothetical protein